MAFDWIRFFQQQNIDYVETGPNVSKGNVNIHCPFCGDADPSHHLGVSLSGAGWGCWRDPTHRGKSPKKLIIALTGCSPSAAMAMIGEESVAMPRDPMAEVLERLSPARGENAPALSRKLKLPKSFKPFRETTAFKPYEKYLRRRGFTSDCIFNMTDRFQLYYCTVGPFAGRIIFAVRDMQGALVSWTGRAISKNVGLRYKTLPHKEESREDRSIPLALGPVNNYLLWGNDLLDSPHDTLVLVEGPFDALKVRVLGDDYGVTSTCFFTQAPSARQIDDLYEVAQHFKRLYLVLDRGTVQVSMRLTAALRTLRVQPLYLPDSVKDPGDLDIIGFSKLLCF